MSNEINSKGQLAFLIIMLIITIIVAVIACIGIKHTSYECGYNDAYDEFANKVTEQRIDSVDRVIVDIRTKIDTIYVYRTKIVNVYDKKVAEVNNLSDSASLVFFKSYLSERFDGLNSD